MNRLKPSVSRCLVGVFLLSTLAGCLSFGVKTDTVEQKAFALLADYELISSAAVSYVQSPTASPAVVNAIKDANAVTFPAVVATSELARGHGATFCAAGEVVTLPAGMDPEFAAAVCRGDLPTAVAYTAGALSMLRSILLTVTESEP